MNRIALYPGSFDPVTNGHMDILRQSLALADKVVRVFVPAVLAVAAITVAVWLALGPGLTEALVAGVSVLIIACPCAMGLATPVSILVGTGRAAELGVLFRKGDALQRLSDARIVAFDKTGTLTEGKPRIVHVGLAEASEETLLRLAGGLQQGSEHPLAKAVLERCSEQRIALPAVSDSRALAGRGIAGTVEGRQLQLGSSSPWPNDEPFSPLFTPKSAKSDSLGGTNAIHKFAMHAAIVQSSSVRSGA